MAKDKDDPRRLWDALIDGLNSRPPTPVKPKPKPSTPGAKQRGGAAPKREPSSRKSPRTQRRKAKPKVVPTTIGMPKKKK